MNFVMLQPIIFFVLSFCFMVIAVCLIVIIVHSNKKIKQSDKKELIITEEIKSVNTKLLAAAASQNKNGCGHWILI